MASRVAVVTRQVKPLLSSDSQDAKVRVLSLYKAWYRHIPFMCKDFSLPRNVDQCRDVLRWVLSSCPPLTSRLRCAGLSSGRTRPWEISESSTCSSSRSVQSVTFEGSTGHCHNSQTFTYSRDWSCNILLLKRPYEDSKWDMNGRNESPTDLWPLDLPTAQSSRVLQGQQDLKEVVEHWKQPTHIMAKWFPEDNRAEKPKDFISKFLSGQE